jgi:threonine dehydrogenase-like Zn-dependent dehydrogenase
MATLAKAAVLTGPRQIAVANLALPLTGDEDGILRVEATGVCGADIPPFLGARGQLSPRILGHEIVGRVQAIGDVAAERWGVRAGDRIIVEEHIPCGRCQLCYDGLHRLCIKLRYGSMPVDLSPALWGGYADHLYLHPNAVVYKAPENVPADEVALFIPISNGINWVQETGGARVGSSVVIQGPGQHGLGCVIGAVECGADPIVVLGLSTDRRRLDLAKSLGATHVIEADREDAVERVREATRGRMADVVIDATAGAGKPSFRDAFALVKEVAGTIVLATGFRYPQNVPDDFGPRMLTVKTVWGRDPHSVEVALRIIESKKYPTAEFCTHSFPVEETRRALLTAAREEVDAGDDPIHVCVVPGA